MWMSHDGGDSAKEGGTEALHNIWAVSGGRANAAGAVVLTRVALDFRRGGDASGREEYPAD
jgi:hypothetical protein